MPLADDLRDEAKEITTAASMLSGLDAAQTQLVSHIVATLSVRILDTMARVVENLQAQEVTEEVQSFADRMKADRERRMKFTAALNKTIAEGDWKEYDRLVGEHFGELRESLDAGAGASGSGEEENRG